MVDLVLCCAGQGRSRYDDGGLAGSDGLGSATIRAAQIHCHPFPERGTQEARRHAASSRHILPACWPLGEGPLPCTPGLPLQLPVLLCTCTTAPRNICHLASAEQSAASQICCRLAAAERALVIQHGVPAEQYIHSAIFNGSGLEVREGQTSCPLPWQCTWLPKVSVQGIAMHCITGHQA